MMKAPPAAYNEAVEITARFIAENVGLGAPTPGMMEQARELVHEFYKAGLYVAVDPASPVNAK